MSSAAETAAKMGWYASCPICGALELESEMEYCAYCLRSLCPKCSGMHDDKCGVKRNAKHFAPVQNNGDKT